MFERTRSECRAIGLHHSGLHHTGLHRGVNMKKRKRKMSKTLRMSIEEVYITITNTIASHFQTGTGFMSSVIMHDVLKEKGFDSEVTAGFLCVPNEAPAGTAASYHVWLECRRRQYDTASTAEINLKENSFRSKALPPGYRGGGEVRVPHGVLPHQCLQERNTFLLEHCSGRAKNHCLQMLREVRMYGSFREAGSTSSLLDRR